MPDPLANPLPSIAVLSDKFIEGAMNLDDEVPPLQVVSFDRAFGIGSAPREEWTTDAHFVCYRPSEHFPQDAWPRCNKPLLSKVRSAGGDLLMSCLAFDYDTPGHQVWTKESLDGFLDKLAEVAASWPLASQFALFYTTRHGARLVYVFDTPIPVDVAESKHRWIVQQFTQRGIPLDPKCSDWTRVFRLPFVLRDGKRTALDPIGEIVEQTANRISGDWLLSAVAPEGEQEYADIHVSDDPKPDREEALALLWMNEGQKATDWCARAKRRLKGRECFGCIFDHQPIAAAGERDNRIQQYVGQVIGLLHDPPHFEGTTPTHIYGLLLPAVEQLEPDAQTPDWSRVLWDKIRRTWAKQDAKIVARKEVVQQAAATAQDVFQSVLAGMKTWCKHPHLTDPDPKKVVDYVTHHMIASVSNTYFLMQPNGFYYPVPLMSQQIVALAKRMGIAQIMEVERMIDGGGMVPLALNELLSKHGTIVHDVIMSPKQSGGAIIDNVDKPEAVLRTPGFERRTDLVPTWDRDVDLWLREFFGDEYEIGCRWIAWSLAFDEGPIAALSIKGEQGSGKKLLTHGLAECLKKAVLADHNDLTSPYQYGLLKSPFLCVDEGFPRATRDMGPYHTFRLLVGGGAVRANQKNLHPIEIRCPFRIIFTANNDNIVETLVGAANLSAEDRASLAIRLIHIDIGDRASVWLRQHGGLNLTAKPGRRWIAGDGGENSDYVVAKHFLWLYQNGRRLRGSRLLVEGNTSTDIMFKLRTQSGAAPLVIETIISMLSETVLGPDICIEDDRLYTVTHGVVDHFRRKMASKTKENLTDNMVASVLKGLAVRQRTNALELKKGRRRWVEIDCGALLQAAEKTGHVCKALSELVDRQTLRDRQTTS